MDNFRYFIVTIHCKTEDEEGFPKDSAYMTIPVKTTDGTYINEKFIEDIVYSDEEIAFCSITNIIEVPVDDFLDFKNPFPEPRTEKKDINGLYNEDAQANFLNFIKFSFSDDEPEDDFPVGSDIGKCPVCGKRQQDSTKPYCSVEHQLEDLL